MSTDPGSAATIEEDRIPYRPDVRLGDSCREREQSAPPIALPAAATSLSPPGKSRPASKWPARGVSLSTFSHSSRFSFRFALDPVIDRCSARGVPIARTAPATASDQFGRLRWVTLPQPGTELGNVLRRRADAGPGFVATKSERHKKTGPATKPDPVL